MATPTDPAIPAFPGVGSAPQTTDRIPIFRDGDPQQRMVNISDLRTAMGDTAPSIDVLSQTGIDYDDFTDGGAAVGTLTMTNAIPAGSIVLGTKVLVSAGFAGDTSATLTIGDGSDVDRYMTGTPSVFATAATGIQTGVPSGNKLITAANQPVLTVTSNADFTSVSAGTMDVYIYFIRTVDA